MLRKFSCIDECSDCCIYREYYPSIEFGKIGVLLLPNEKQRIETYAKELGMEITILPRVGIGRKKRKNEPETIIAYQLMGKNSEGEVCPFLEMEGAERSPHGGFKCKIYDKKPVACSAYPVNIEDKETVTLDRKCKFCRVNNKEQADGMRIQKLSVRKEIIALRKIQNSTLADASVEIWRYATAIGENQRQKQFYPRGWVLQDDVRQIVIATFYKRLAYNYMDCRRNGKKSRRQLNRGQTHKFNYLDSVGQCKKLRR